MDSDQPSSCEPSPKPRPFQFSLATMLVATAGVAVLFGGIFVMPYLMAGLTTLIIVLSLAPALVVAANCNTGNAQAFCIGALVPAGLCLASVFLMGHWDAVVRSLQSYSNSNPVDFLVKAVVRLGDEGVSWRPIAVVSWVAALVTGLVCAATRWAFTRNRK